MTAAIHGHMKQACISGRSHDGTGMMRDETGATAVEYGFLAALIAVVIIAGVQFVGEQLLAIFNEVLAWF